MVTQVANIRAGSEPQLIWPQTLLSLHCTIFMRRSEVKLLSCVQLFATPWTVAYQSPLSMGLSRQEYWSGLHFLLQGTFLTQGSNTDLRHCRQTLSPSQPQWEYAINQGTIWTKKWWLKGNREGQKVPFTLNKFMSWRSSWGEMHFQQRDEVFQHNSVLFIAFGNIEGGKWGT